MSDAEKLNSARREHIEAANTWHRITELRLDPVLGNFNVAHLKEINRRIFQDLPGLGFSDVTPGEFRPAVPAGVDRTKSRKLESVDVVYEVAYSKMDQAAITRLDKALERADPAHLRELDTATFTEELGKLYAELDYIHPFPDGNSRTLRTFTEQLAKESGYTLDWQRFNENQAGRDILCVARDISVCELAYSRASSPTTKRDIFATLDRFSGNRDMPDLLRDAIRPMRAVAFERMTEAEAVQAHPELAEAYEVRRAGAAYFENQLAGKPEAQKQAMKVLAEKLQDRLNRGQREGFMNDDKPRSPRKATSQAPQQAHRSEKPGRRR